VDISPGATRADEDGFAQTIIRSAKKAAGEGGPARPSGDRRLRVSGETATSSSHGKIRGTSSMNNANLPQEGKKPSGRCFRGSLRRRTKEDALRMAKMARRLQLAAGV